MNYVGKIRVCEMFYRIYIVSRKEMGKVSSKTSEGACDIFKSRIYIRQDVAKNADRFLDTVVHEYKHAWLDASGVGYWLQKKGVNLEKFIRLTTPGDVGLLRTKLLRTK